MRLVYLLLLSFIFLAALPRDVIAQEEARVDPLDYRQSYIIDPLYREMARDALKNKSPRFDFMQFRSYYSRTRQYDPLSEDTLQELNSLAYIVLNDEDPERAETALFAYQAVTSDHLANIDVVMQALSLARQDSRFGNPAFFEWMRDGLVRTVTISGDGYTLRGAYDVITTTEEILLFNRLGFQRVDTQAVKEASVYYNMHEVIDTSSGETRTVFVNTTIPMRYLDAIEVERQKALTLDIRKQ